jgi:cell division protein FtsW
MGIGYQLKQVLITVGSGRIFGVEGDFSLGLSRQKFGFLPQPMNDSIFAIYSEETGFIGATLLIFLFLILAWRGFQISKLIAERDFFLGFLAFGITFWLVVQAFINIGAIIGVLPLTGIPLTFISYGGSALIAELIGLGILIKISSIVSK